LDFFSLTGDEMKRLEAGGLPDVQRIVPESGEPFRGHG
jgi:hypothetical protein